MHNIIINSTICACIYLNLCIIYVVRIQEILNFINQNNNKFYLIKFYKHMIYTVAMGMN